MDDGERIGIFGGTFDPVHVGHLILARDAVEQLGLAQMIFVPAAISPHKLEHRPAAPADGRLEMLRAAVAGEPRFVVDDCELHRAGPSYTVDTIEAFRAQLPGHPLVYLIGADNLRELHTWHRIADLRALVDFVVFPREVAMSDETHLLALPEPKFAGLKRIVALSSTEIRYRVASGRSIRYLVPDAVAALIAARGWYRQPPVPAISPAFSPSP